MLALVWHMLVRVILGVLPFLAAIGVVNFALLRPHDINYYLAQRPPVFYVAAAIGAVILAALANPSRADNRPLGTRATARPV